MPRPCKCRRIYGNPRVDYFKPWGLFIERLDEPLEETVLTVDEFEAIRLADLEGLYQEEAAKKMNISRQTFANIIESARRKIADAIVNVKVLKIGGGVIQMIQKHFVCSDCNHQWSQNYGTGRPEQCPNCQSKNIHRSAQDRGYAHGGGRMCRRMCRRPV